MTFIINFYRMLRTIAGIYKSIVMTQTRVLPVKKDSIVFDAGASLPRISDKETEKNLRIVADELINTDNAVAFPTETVYGLGGSALRDESVKAIYRAKNRPADNPLIVHVSSIEQLERILLQDYKIPHQYRQLIEKFWPGPLTILLPVLKGSGISKYVTAEQDTFAVRIPGNIIARSLIAISDTPLAAPSANASTRPSPTTADHVYSDLQGKIPYILDGGSSSVGVESTVVDGLSDPPKILRPGGISAEQIRQVGGPQWRDVQVMTKSNASEPVRTPGMKYKHYSPTAKVILFIDCGNGIEAINKYIRDTNSSQKRIALLKTRQFVRESDVHRNIVVEKELGVSGADISRNLFSALREVDTKEVDLIFVEGVAEDNEGLAIMNRLTKAASDVINSS